jgi:hypothetical protein
MSKYPNMFSSGDLPICTAYGTQYDATEGGNPTTCRICDVKTSISSSQSKLTLFQDPRQYVPPSGQSFTTLNKMQRKYKNIWLQDEGDKRVWGVHTEPRVGIPNPERLH